MISVLLSLSYNNRCEVWMSMCFFIPLQMHIVHFKQSYVTITEALNHPDGLAVVGFFFEVK